jgi:5'-deoxynucleotidase YfbR-like HD superfamily hydrolase
MSERWERLCDFLIDTERLKRVERTAWVSDLSRHENTAEHSWHLTLGLLAVARELDLDIDLAKAMRMAVIHDLCEIDTGDVSAYDTARRAAIAVKERAAIARLSACGLALGPEIEALWLEYEAQQTPESRWVRVLDRLLPFVVNLGNGGQAWKDGGITRSQLLQINAPVRDHAPEIFAWMLTRIDDCVSRGWLKEG